MRAQLTTSLIFGTTFLCCCCGGLGGNFFDEAQMQELLSGNIENIIEESANLDLDEILPTPTPVEESGEAVPAEEGASESSDAAAEAPPDTDKVQEEADEIAESLLEHLEDGSDEPFTFGCDNPNIPMPADIEGCVSLLGSTTYSSEVGEDEINKMYDDYFTGQGWEEFPMMIREGVLNAWQRKGGQNFAVLVFVPGGGENGKNMVSITIVGEE